MKFKITIILLVFWLLICPCYPSDVLFVGVSPKASVSGQQLDLACRFYGLDMERLFVEEDKNNLSGSVTLKRRAAGAIVITASALSSIDKQQVLSALLTNCKKSVPLLIMGVTSGTDPSLLNRWSGGVVIGCTDSVEVPTSGFYKVADRKVITRELEANYFCINKT